MRQGVGGEERQGTGPQAGTRGREVGTQAKRKADSNIGAGTVKAWDLSKHYSTLTYLVVATED
jgi:hypothetical protein